MSLKIVDEHTAAHSGERLYCLMMQGWSVVSANPGKQEWKLSRPKLNSEVKPDAKDQKTRG